MLFEFSNQILAAKLNLEKPKKEVVSSKIVTDSRKISKFAKKCVRFCSKINSKHSKSPIF